MATNEIYHVFNRSVGNENIFATSRNLTRAVELIDYYRFAQKIRYSQFKLLSADQRKNYILDLRKKSPLIEIYTFALMPNHFHFLLKQLEDRGILIFLSNLQNSYAKYYNLKNKRQGAVFQNSFKGKRVATDEELIHTSRYIHLNPVTSFLIEINKLPEYPWTSLFWYFDESRNKFITTKFLQGYFKTKEKYWQFVSDQADYQRKLEIIKNLTVD